MPEDFSSNNDSSQEITSSGVEKTTAHINWFLGLTEEEEKEAIKEVTQRMKRRAEEASKLLFQ